MNTSLFLILASLSGAPFHFKDCVVVTKGFYEGCRGTLEEEISTDPIQYDVHLNCRNETMNVAFKVDELKKCDK